MTGKENRTAVDGEGNFLLIDKEADWTSFDVVAKIRNTYTAAGLKRKVGHSGTLDPLATGLLIVATGKKTKQLASLETLDKVYEGTIKLGAMTESHDRETPEYGHCSVEQVTEKEIQAAAHALEGRQMQKPPMHSAAWHKGKRLYELARKGKHVAERKAREIVVQRFEVTAVELPYVSFRMKVSRGAYIRVLAHDFGALLGVGGYLFSLRRVSIGEYRLQDARSVSETVEVIMREAKETQE